MMAWWLDPEVGEIYIPRPLLSIDLFVLTCADDRTRANHRFAMTSPFHRLMSCLSCWNDSLHVSNLGSAFVVISPALDLLESKHVSRTADDRECWQPRC